MAKRQRDYRAEYHRRKARAIREGFTGYAQQRKVRRYTHDLARRFMERIDTSGFDLAELLESEESDSVYWVWFRVNYNKGTQPA